MAATMMRAIALRKAERDWLSTAFNLGVLIGACGMLVFVFLFVLLMDRVRAQDIDAELIPPTAQEAADIRTWIPYECCWSNNCCRKVGESAFTPLGNGNYRIVASGQVVTRNGWSRDGNNWRCTCDHIDGRWVVHLKANTRCLFPAAPAGS